MIRTTSKGPWKEMISSAQGIVEAGDGGVDLVVEPPTRTLAEAMPGEHSFHDLRDLLFETGVNRGPVNVDVRVLETAPVHDDPGGFEDVWEDIEIRMPPGQVFLNGPTTDALLQLGELETPKVLVFRVYGSGRDNMRDLVASEVVERYLVQVWEIPAPGDRPE